MTNRERIINTLMFKEVDRPPFFFAFGPWTETEERWRKEGLEPGKSWDEGFGFDPGILSLETVNLGYYPPFEEKILEDKGDSVIRIDYRGIILEDRKDGGSIPKFIDYPVKTVSDWEKLKAERLDPDDPGRFPSDWLELAKKYNEGDQAIQIGDYPYGLFGTLRDMMGVEELLVAFYDEPEMIKDMMGHLTDCWIRIYEKVCKDVKVDIIHMWEDMSGKQGSLISPAMIREFMLPNYKKIKDFADAHGIMIFSLDTDGNCEELVPLYMESGINFMYPFEVAAGSDIVSYRKRYPTLGIMGGIDKQEIAKGPEAIDRELERIAEMFKYKGYIPALDHLIHPEISLEDFKYFVTKLKSYILGTVLAV